MRIIRDGFAHIDIDGVRVHTKVRAVVSDDERVAVFLSPTSGPAHVYSVHDVVMQKTSASCSHPVCFGKVSRQGLARLWAAHEAELTADAV